MTLPVGISFHGPTAEQLPSHRTAASPSCRRTNREQGLGIREKHRFSVSERRRQIPVEEETDSWNPYHYPWSAVVAKTPQLGGILGRCMAAATVGSGRG